MFLLILEQKFELWVHNTYKPKKYKKMVSTMLAVYIPCPTKKKARDIAALLLQKKLIACANIFPSTSMYFWKGKLHNTKEFIILAKTMENKYKEIEKIVLSTHSYNCPCITAWKIDKSTAAYTTWLKTMVK